MSQLYYIRVDDNLGRFCQHCVPYGGYREDGSLAGLQQHALGNEVYCLTPPRLCDGIMPEALSKLSGRWW